MINPIISRNNELLEQLSCLNSLNLLLNDIATLKLVIALHPWFSRLLESIKLNITLQECLNTSKLDQNKIIEALGYWSWVDDLEAIKLVETEKQSLQINKNTPNSNETEVHDSHSKIDTDYSKSEDWKHEIDDEYLLSIHPNEVKYYTNPKTGRKVKKLVCKVPGWGKIFEKKWNFKDHIRMHMGEKPYNCKVWGKSFTQKGNLIKHNRQHVFSDLKSRKVYEWNVWCKKFTEKYNLKVSI